jgi:formylglycine-generating enzyme required for sulfatase activity
LNRLIEIFGKEDVQRLDESSMPLLIGTSVEAHIRLDDGHEIVAYVAESRKHLFLQPADNHQAGFLYHNDESVTGSVWLKSEDITRFGDTEIRWFFSGQRVEVHVSKTSRRVLRPPAEPPPGQQEARKKDAPEEPLPPVAEAPVRKNSKARSIAIGLFALLLIAAAFVLLAKPLAVTVTPAPDNISVSGFPPVMTFGDRYLGFPGNYTLHAEKKGYLPLAQAVEIAGSDSSYNFSLEKLPGLIDLTSTPTGVTVLVDEIPIGETPLQNVAISAGNRTIRFEHKRYLPEERTLEIKGFGERQSLQVDLEPSWAKVALQTEPQGASLTVDGEEMGETPLELELIAGTRQLVFSKEKFSPHEVELAIEAGQDSSPDVYPLKPAPAALAISSVPSGATVSIDGTFKGLTPLSLSLPPGDEQVVRMTLAGHSPAKQKLSLEPEEKRELVVKLEPEYGTVFIVANPAGASLAIDGKGQKLANGRFRLTTRPHTIKLKADGYQSATRTVTPKASYSQRIEIDLKRKQAAGQTAQAKGSKPTPQAGLNQKAAPKQKTGLNQKLVLITPKSFLMGASRKEAGRRANESEHQVTMKRSFYLSEREVSNAEYKLFQAQHSSGMMGNRSLEIDSHPVANITWDDAARFLNWLSRKDGLPPFYVEKNGAMVASEPAGIGYRLPTEAEWAFAARMAARKERVRYPWPGKYPPLAKSGNFADESSRHLLPVVIADYNDGFPASAPTGSFAANPTGIFDLGGNVAEWCHDHYVANPAGKGAADPMGPASGAHHVVRGSSWRDASITELRFSYRRYNREAANDIGFRIARYAQ